jgi:O-antigen ligase
MSGLLPLGVLLFLASAFIAPTEAAFSLVFYICVVPPAAAAWRKLAIFGPAERLALALIIWSALTLLWGEDDGNRSARFLLGAACTWVFVRAMCHVLVDPAWRQLLITVLIWAATANAAGVLILKAPALLDGARILGWGVTRQPILGGSVMALACITALFRSRLAGLQDAGHTDDACSYRASAAYLAAAGVMAVFAVAMQSRGALIGFAGAILVLAWHVRRWRGLMACVVALKAFIVAAPARLREPVLGRLLDRGTSHRPEIWARSWQLIREKPWFGHGLAANLPISPTGFPHSLYLSLLFYSGAVGFALFVAMMIAVAGRLLRARPGTERVWVTALLLNALLAGVTDFGQITKGPGPLWFILWLPVALALSLPLSQRAADAALPSAAS